METNLKDKVVLVTGGSRGIGKAICLAFAKEGAKVAVNYLSTREKAEAVANEIQQKYQTAAVSVKADVSKEPEVILMIKTVYESLGAVDILVNNAAYCPSGPIASYSVEEWEKTFGVNVTGMFVASREVVKRWQEHQVKGTIVNIASRRFQGIYNRTSAIRQQQRRHGFVHYRPCPGGGQARDQGKWSGSWSGEDRNGG